MVIDSSIVCGLLSVWREEQQLRLQHHARLPAAPCRDQHEVRVCARVVPARGGCVSAPAGAHGACRADRSAAPAYGQGRTRRRSAAHTPRTRRDRPACSRSRCAQWLLHRPVRLLRTRRESRADWRRRRRTRWRAEAPVFAQVAGDDGKVFRQMVHVNIFPRLRGGVRQDLKAGHAHVGMIPQEQQAQRAAAGPEVAHGGPARQTAEIGQHHRVRRQAEAARL